MLVFVRSLNWIESRICGCTTIRALHVRSFSTSQPSAENKINATQHRFDLYDSSVFEVEVWIVDGEMKFCSQHLSVIDQGYFHFRYTDFGDTSLSYQASRHQHTSVTQVLAPQTTCVHYFIVSYDDIELHVWFAALNLVGFSLTLSLWAVNCFIFAVFF